ncbi:DTW domain-containing protein [bacterium]|nr:DTW domain-containing protein [bacterium]
MLRDNCYFCRRPKALCYCGLITPVDSSMQFVILIHPIENKRKIATGRMAHLCLKNSRLITGHDYSDNIEVNKIITDPQNDCFLLYPGNEACDLSVLVKKEEKTKQKVIFVVDGTWATAKKTVKLSRNLQQLPTICFTPPKPSSFRIRKQPKPYCYSTIEAIHHILDYFEPKGDREGKPHDILLTLFNRMVEQQIEFVPLKT